MRGGKPLSLLGLCGFFMVSTPVGGATLAGRIDPIWDPVVNLTEEGTLDWGHWGLENEWSYTHKYGVAQQITYSFITVEGYAGWPGPYIVPLSEPRYGGVTPFSWTDGTPVRAQDNTLGGISIYGDKITLGNVPPGFRIQCPADTSPKTLKVYVGNSWGPATFAASLNGAPPYIDTTLDGRQQGEGASVSRVYTLVFQADSPGQTLTAEFTSTDSRWYTTLQAATLAGPNHPPTVAITAPADGSSVPAPGTFSVNATGSDRDGTVTNLTLLSGGTVVAASASATLSATLRDRPAGEYDLLAVATDNGGLSITSRPVRVFVTNRGGTLAGSVDPPPVSVDLTAEGTADWAHWGLNAPGDFDRKSGVVQAIPGIVLLNAATTELTSYTDNPTAFTWSDGMPTAAVPGGSTTGVYVNVTNTPPAGFQLTMPAISRSRRLKLYVGLSYAQGRLDARLSDFSALPYSDTSLFQSDNNGTVVYTLTFASANPGANLIVTWTPATSFNPFYANLSWQAATLTELDQVSAPMLRVVQPPPAPGKFALGFYAQNGTRYTVQFADNPGFANLQTLTNFTGTGADTVVADPGVGASRRFYRVLSQ